MQPHNKVRKRGQKMAPLNCFVGPQKHPFKKILKSEILV